MILHELHVSEQVLIAPGDLHYLIPHRVHLLLNQALQLPEVVLVQFILLLALGLYQADHLLILRHDDLSKLIT